MTEKKPTTNYISIASAVEKEDRGGDLQIHVHINGISVTDKELTDLRRLQDEMARRAGEILEGK